MENIVGGRNQSGQFCIRFACFHGLLHLLGHDHVRGGAQAVRMRAEERRLAKLLRDAQKR